MGKRITWHCCLTVYHLSRAIKKITLWQKDHPHMGVHSACSLCNTAYAIQDLQCLCKGRVTLHNFPISLRKWLRVTCLVAWWYLLTPVAPMCWHNSNFLSPLSAQLSPLQCFLPGQPLEVYRLFSLVFNLSQKNNYSVIQLHQSVSNIVCVFVGEKIALNRIAPVFNTAKHFIYLKNLKRVTIFLIFTPILFQVKWSI